MLKYNLKLLCQHLFPSLMWKINSALERLGWIPWNEIHTRHLIFLDNIIIKYILCMLCLKFSRLNISLLRIYWIQGIVGKQKISIDLKQKVKQTFLQQNRFIGKEEKITIQNIQPWWAMCKSATQRRWACFIERKMKLGGLLQTGFYLLCFLINKDIELPLLNFR